MSSPLIISTCGMTPCAAQKSSISWVSAIPPIWEPANDLPLRAFVNGGKSFAGSQIGGIAETQEMLDFCAEHGVIPQVEMIGGEDITQAYDNIVASRVRYRYVIDTSTFPESA